MLKCCLDKINIEIMVEATWRSGSHVSVIYVLCTTVNVVYHFNCCVPVCSQCTSFFHSVIDPLRFSWVATTVCCICYSVCVVYIVQYFFVFIVHCCVVPLTSVPPTTYPPTIHTTHAPQLVVPPQWVGYILIMTMTTQPRATLGKNLYFFWLPGKTQNAPLCNLCMHEQTNSKNSPDSFSSSWSSVHQ